MINIGIGQRYAIMLRRPEGTQKVYTIRASTMTHQVFQSTALLSYGSQVSLRGAMAQQQSLAGLKGSRLYRRLIRSSNVFALDRCGGQTAELYHTADGRQGFSAVSCRSSPGLQQGDQARRQPEQPYRLGVRVRSTVRFE